MVRHILVLLVLATLSCFFLPAAASLYPTKPISTTIYQAGLPAQVLWIEDGDYPHLNRTGEVRIDLYEGNSTYLATLAKGVDPQALSTTIFIPPAIIPKNYHSFTLHFITVEPHQIIYTADFVIISNSFSSPSLTVSSSSCLITVTSTVISNVLSTQSTVTSATTKKENAAMNIGLGLDHRSFPRGFFAIDKDKMKFRLMFIVWPALMGLSMAL